MRVEDFPRPANDNRRGIHWSASVYHPAGSTVDFWIAELKAMGIKWVKLLDDGGDSSLELCKRLLAAEIMPIVRIFRATPNPGAIGSREVDTIKRLVAEGVRYFETNNEPDLSAEWKDGYVPPDWMNIVVDNFIIDADNVIRLGGLPALPALSIGTKANLIELVVQKGRADLFSNGAWVAVHNYTLNHPLDYPYDPVNQAGAPVSQEEYDRLGAWAWDSNSRTQINEWRATDKNPGATLEQDASCFLSFHLLDQTIVKLLGHKVPIISTEGGPVTGWRDDRRYPRVDPNTQAQWAVAINDFLQGGREINGLRCPDNYFTMCHWLIANYKLGFIAPGWEGQSWYTNWWDGDFNLRGEMPVVAAVKAMPNLPVDGAKLAVIAGVVLRADDESPLPGVTVSLRSGDQEVATIVSADNGTFRFERLTPGVYDLAIPAWGVVRQGVIATQESVQPVTIRLTGGSSSSLTGTVQSAIRRSVGRPRGDVVARRYPDCRDQYGGRRRFSLQRPAAWRLSAHDPWHHRRRIGAGWLAEQEPEADDRRGRGAPLHCDPAAATTCGRNRQSQRILWCGQRRERRAGERDQGADGLARRRSGHRVPGHDHGPRPIQTGREL